MKRNLYDLSHFSLVAGDIGRLQTATVIPIVAGDSISLSYDAIVRLSSLRRNLTLDAKIDLFAFYIPHRQIYGADWINFLKQGVDESVTFTNGPTVGDGTTPEDYLGHRAKLGETYPLWVTAGHNRIRNRYFRVPTDSTAQADAFKETTERGLKYGPLLPRLKTPYSTGIDATTDTSDREVAAASSTMDIIDLAAIKARYRSEQERDYFAQRYTDVLGQIWGGSANAEEDQRPHLIMRNSSMISGTDVDGTADANLGVISGKSVAQVGLRIPSKFFREHGALWIMIAIRFPPVWSQERHYLMNKNNPGYLEISGDPDLVGIQPPQTVSADDWFSDGASNDFGTHPFGQWYRHHPNRIHRQYDALSGFPFTQATPTTKLIARYHTTAEFDSAFQTQQLGQWNASGRVSVEARRVVPTAVRSIFAGA